MHLRGAVHDALATDSRDATDDLAVFGTHPYKPSSALARGFPDNHPHMQERVLSRTKRAVVDICVGEEGCVSGFPSGEASGHCLLGHGASRERPQRRHPGPVPPKGLPCQAVDVPRAAVRSPTRMLVAAAVLGPSCPECPKRGSGCRPSESCRPSERRARRRSALRGQFRRG
jgi:hypothetical protein